MQSTETTTSEPFRDSLKQIWTDRKSGLLCVGRDGQQAGQIVFFNGRVGWAASITQEESLAHFLFRIGRLSSEDFRQIRQDFEAGKEDQQLGVILERRGLMMRSSFRRCLCLHTRRAIGGLFQLDELEVDFKPGDMRFDPALTFGLEEVIPMDETQLLCPSGAMEQQKARWSKITGENRGLESFTELSHYRASAIMSTEGEVLIAHIGGGCSVNPQLLGPLSHPWSTRRPAQWARQPLERSKP
jgi:hypothetical protein